MAKKITIRDVMNEFNISVDTIVDFLKSKDIEVKRATPRAPPKNLMLYCYKNFNQIKV